MNNKLYPAVIIVSFLFSACGGDQATAKETQRAASVVDVAAPANVPEPVLTPQEALIEKGRIKFKRCSSCHTLGEGDRQRVGPNLWGVFGATAGTKAGFNYSTAMADSGIVWTDENMAAYIENPRKFMPKNKMTFVGLRKPEDQAAVIAYLKSKTMPVSGDQ